jgi:hypothetical protein
LNITQTGDRVISGISFATKGTDKNTKVEGIVVKGNKVYEAKNYAEKKDKATPIADESFVLDLQSGDESLGHVDVATNTDIKEYSYAELFYGKTKDTATTKLDVKTGTVTVEGKTTDYGLKLEGVNPTSAGGTLGTANNRVVKLTPNKLQPGYYKVVIGKNQTTYKETYLQVEADPALASVALYGVSGGSPDTEKLTNVVVNGSDAKSGQNKVLDDGKILVQGLDSGNNKINTLTLSSLVIKKTDGSSVSDAKKTG